MLGYLARRLLVHIPVYLGVLFLLMWLLRLNDPAYAYLGKSAEPGDVERLREGMGLDRPLVTQYGEFVGRVVRLDFSEPSWDRRGRSVGDLLRTAAVPTLSITVPALLLGVVVSLTCAMLAVASPGRIRRLILTGSVLAMSISALSYALLGQIVAAAWLNDWLSARAGEPVQLFAVRGYELGLSGWCTYCALPVLLGALMTVGPDTRFATAVLSHQALADDVTTARANGAGPIRIALHHVLRGALVPLLTRVMVTVPFLISGSILLERVFDIPGMGSRLLQALAVKDFPVIQAFTAVFAAVFVISHVINDLLVAWADPRVRLTAR